MKTGEGGSRGTGQTEIEGKEIRRKSDSEAILRRWLCSHTTERRSSGGLNSTASRFGYLVCATHEANKIRRADRLERDGHRGLPAERGTGERREEKKSVMIYVAPIKSVRIFRFQLSAQQFR